MKRILLTTLLLFSISMADTILLVKKGWQLIGSATPIDNMSKFKADSVEQVWHFDADTQKWLGYSPDAKIQSKMSEKGISKLTSLKSWHGFWVKSKKEWRLILPTRTISKTPTDENSSNDIIYLKKGWNLISLPIDSVVSADIFKNMTVWKYNSNREWEVFDRDKKSVENFPKISHIKNSDGLWVKAEKDTNISVMKEASKLHNFKTSKEMEDYIKSTIEINQRPICGFEPIYSTRGAVNTAVPTTADATLEGDNNGVKNATSTNLQESGVDEADILKHNGTNIFYIQKGEYNQNSYINITSFKELSQGNSKPINQITFDKNQTLNSLYIIDNRLVVLSYNYAKDEVETAKEQIVVDIFDVSDIKDIKKMSSYKIDGNLVTSRVIGDNLYLVSNFYPKYHIEYPKEYITLSETCKEYFEDNPPPLYPVDVKDYKPYNPDKYAECYSIYREEDTDRYYRYNYEKPILKIIDLLPDIEGSSITKHELIKPQRLYTSSKENQNSNISTISTINISSGKYQLSNSFMGYSSTEYASPKALYLVSNQYPIYYDFYNYKERSSIYKFNLDNNLSYRGIGYVYGHTLNQFSLSEYRDILRVATTEGFSWTQNKNNSIYTLKEDNGLLSIQGVLSGLGKDGETIKSVRFMGDKGYIVTFRQTDPLYTIDMSNPKAPKKVGELKVNGYSAYLHPVDDNRLLGIGRDASSDGRVQGIKIELFDISDFANPTSLDSIILDKGTSSEIERNHKALAYRAIDNLFAFPYYKNGDYANDYKTHHYLGIYQIKDNEIITYPKIKSSISNWSESRGLIFDMDNQTYISFFANGKVITEKLEER